MELWKDFVNGKYDVYLSQVTLDEIEKCSEPKRNVLYDYLSDIVNIKTIRGVRAITNLEGYKGIDIINPSVLLESIHKIREQNYERTKDMTVAEKVAYYNNSGKEAEREIERRRALKRKVVASM